MTLQIKLTAQDPTEDTRTAASSASFGGGGGGRAPIPGFITGGGDILGAGEAIVGGVGGIGDA